MDNDSVNNPSQSLGIVPRGRGRGRGRVYHHSNGKPLLKNEQSERDNSNRSFPARGRGKRHRDQIPLSRSPANLNLDYIPLGTSSESSRPYRRGGRSRRGNNRRNRYSNNNNSWHQDSKFSWRQPEVPFTLDSPDDDGKNNLPEVLAYATLAPDCLPFLRIAQQVLRILPMSEMTEPFTYTFPPGPGRWRRACYRFARLIELWPDFFGVGRARHVKAEVPSMVDIDDTQVERCLLSVLWEFFPENPKSDLYKRHRRLPKGDAGIRFRWEKGAFRDAVFYEYNPEKSRESLSQFLERIHRDHDLDGVPWDSDADEPPEIDVGDDSGSDDNCRGTAYGAGNHASTYLGNNGSASRVAASGNRSDGSEDGSPSATRMNVVDQGTVAKSTLEQPIDSGKGFQMLLKMGWKQGEGLGARGNGIKDPLSAQQWKYRGGLGTG